MKNCFKKSLALIMTVLMLMTAWVFVTPEKAVAAVGLTSQTAGGYYLKVTHTAPGDVSSTSKGGWGKTPNDAYIVSSRTYANNGRSDSASYGWNYWTGTGSKTYVEPRSGDNDGSPLTSPVGFPDGVYASLNDDKVAGSTTAKVTKIEIGSSTSNYTTVWTGTGYMNSTSNPYYVYIYASDNKTGSSDGGNSDNYGYVTTTSKNWTMPYPICTYQGDEYVYVSQNGTTQKTYGISTAKDQYGVNWGFSSVTWESSNSSLASINNNGVATFGWNNGMEYDVKLTPTLVHSSGNKKPTGKTVHVRPLKDLSLNTEESVNISVSNGQRWYKFTPSSSGDYVFFSYGTSVDSQIYVYDSSFNQLAYDDDYSNNGTAPASSTNTGGKGSDIRVLLGNGTTSSTTQSYVVDSTESYTVVNLTANSTYYVKARCYNTKTGTYPMKVCKAVNITFNGAGGKKSSNNSVTYIMPAGHTMHLDKTGFTRSDHTLLGWCATAYDYMRREPREYTAAQTITVPDSDTTYVALWNPTDPSTVSVNTDYTASVPNAYQITYYKFSPTETRDYIYYSKASASDPYGVLYNANDWANSGSILAYDDDSGNSNSSFTGSSSAGNFFIRKELTKNTNYLLGVKRYNTGTGDVPFRIEPVYKVEYDANSGSGAPSKQDKFVGKTLTLSSTQPTRTGYTFQGWSTSSSATSATYSAGGSYTANADAKLYAVWKANTYTVKYDGNGMTGGSTADSTHTYDVYKDLTANGYERKFTVSFDATTNGGESDPASLTATASFGGWAETASGTKKYDNQASVRNLASAQDAIVNLYAKWTDGSVTLPGAVARDFDDDYHYSFDGWYTAASDGTKVGNADASYTPTANTTLFAQYTRTAHSFDSGSVTLEPTYSIDGTRTCNCSGCTKTKPETIPKLESLIELPDVIIENSMDTSSTVKISPKVNTISGKSVSYQIVGFAQNKDHTLYTQKSSADSRESLRLTHGKVMLKSGSDNSFNYQLRTMNFTDATLDTVYVLLKVTGTEDFKYSTDDIYTYQKITLVPPKSVMYDDTVGAMQFFDSTGLELEDVYGKWTRIDDSGSTVTDAAAVDEFGDITTAQQSTEDSVKYSFGDAHQVRVSDTLVNPNWPKTQFTFTGTGFDLLSVTDSNSGVFSVKVYPGTSATGNTVYSKIVDTYYGYSYGDLYYKPWRQKIVIGNDSGGIPLYEMSESAYSAHPDEAIIGSLNLKPYTTKSEYAAGDTSSPARGWAQSESEESLYQVLVISKTDLNYGVYTVVVEPRFTTRFGHYKTDADGTKYYTLTVDGVRIYGPADGNQTALNKYRGDGEEYTKYVLIKDNSNLVTGSDNSYIIIDGMRQLSAAEFKEYILGSSNNELYLMPGGTVAFDIENIPDLTDAKIGLKAINGKTCNVSIAKGGGQTLTANPISVTSATEQYISLKTLLNKSGSTTIVITNNSNSLGNLSLTKLMLSSNTSFDSDGGYISAGPQTAPRALAVVQMLNADLTIDEETVETASSDDGTVTLTLQTSEDAETIVIRDGEGNVIDPESIDFTIDEEGIKHWVVTLTESESGEYSYTLQAEYENGYAPEEPTTVTVTVTIPETEQETNDDQSAVSMLAKLKGFFERLIEFIRRIVALFT